eukprot:TRINITY_DN1054_c0_g1_i4.p1 TRINITY_DN1054_c0_g1~~TRINITY_DN1054_c0_g1_i4.p1  ORF type:complete len:299 (-),score=97.27 TRINITY_DN1054_c0_g1_i4:158-1015(-)
MKMRQDIEALKRAIDFSANRLMSPSPDDKDDDGKDENGTKRKRLNKQGKEMQQRRRTQEDNELGAKIVSLRAELEQHPSMAGKLWDVQQKFNAPCNREFTAALIDKIFQNWGWAAAGPPPEGKYTREKIAERVEVHFHSKKNAARQAAKLGADGMEKKNKKAKVDSRVDRKGKLRRLWYSKWHASLSEEDRQRLPPEGDMSPLFDPLLTSDEEDDPDDKDCVVVRPLPWRSDLANNLIRQLDAFIEVQRRSHPSVLDKIKKKKIGPISDRPRPAEIPVEYALWIS